MKIAKLLAPALLLACKGCLTGCAVEGLHSANPRTIVRAGSFAFENGKDVSATLESGRFDPQSRAFEIKNLEILDTASTVRRANAEQIDALARESFAIGQAWSLGLTAGAQLAQQLVPFVASFAAKPPWGTGQPGLAPPGYVVPASQPSIEDIARRLEALEAAVNQRPENESRMP